MSKPLTNVCFFVFLCLYCLLYRQRGWRWFLNSGTSPLTWEIFAGIPQFLELLVCFCLFVLFIFLLEEDVCHFAEVANEAKLFHLYISEYEHRTRKPFTEEMKMEYVFLKERMERCMKDYYWLYQDAGDHRSKTQIYFNKKRGVYESRLYSDELKERLEHYSNMMTYTFNQLEAYFG